MLCPSTDNANNLLAGSDVGKSSRSTDSGSSSLQVGDSTSEVFPFATLHNSVIFAGILGKGVMKSTDEGLSCLEHHTGLPGKFVYALTSDSPGNLYSGTSDAGLYELDNKAAGWKDFDSGLKYADVISLTIDQSGCLYAGLTGGAAYRNALPVTTAIRASNFGPRSAAFSQSFPDPFNPQTTISFGVAAQPTFL